MGWYILEVQCRGGSWICLDATRRIDCWARYINHSLPGSANAKLMPPVMMDGHYRVGIISVCDILTGEEITYDYGAQSNAPPWLSRRPVAKVCIHSTFIYYLSVC